MLKIDSESKTTNTTAPHLHARAIKACRRRLIYVLLCTCYVQTPYYLSPTFPFQAYAVACGNDIVGLHHACGLRLRTRALSGAICSCQWAVDARERRCRRRVPAKQQHVALVGILRSYACASVRHRRPTHARPSFARQLSGRPAAASERSNPAGRRVLRPGTRSMGGDSQTPVFVYRANVYTAKAYYFVTESDEPAREIPVVDSSSEATEPADWYYHSSITRTRFSAPAKPVRYCWARISDTPAAGISTFRSKAHL